MDRKAALRSLREYGFPLGSEGPAIRAYWDEMCGYLRDGTLSRKDVPRDSFENALKKARYNLYACMPRDPDTIIGEPKRPSVFKTILAAITKGSKTEEKQEMVEVEGPAPAPFPADEATQELWDANKKLIFADEMDSIRRSRQMFDTQVIRAADFNSQLQQLAIQAMQNAVESANILSKKSLKEHDLVTALELRDAYRDNFPFDMQGDLEMNEAEDE